MITQAKLKTVSVRNQSVYNGERQIRDDWSAVDRRVCNAKSVKVALQALALLLTIPKYGIAKVKRYDPKSGQPETLDWVIDSKSTIKSYDLHYSPNSVLKTFSAKCVKTEMPATVFDFDDYRVLITIERVSTGGGHNDFISYEDHAVARIVNIINYEGQ